MKRSTPNALARWWRRWVGCRAAELVEACRLGANDVEYLTNGAWSAAPDPQGTTGAGPDQAKLLERRMMALDLDPYELGLSEAALARLLQRRCGLCGSRDRCIHDLEQEPADPVWREYCPNATTLTTLSTLQRRSSVAPKFQFPYLG